MITIRLRSFDEHFEDFYDSEKEAYIVYAGKAAADFNIATSASIVDYDGLTWNCYLFAAEYIPSIDAYELTYKAYKGA